MFSRKAEARSGMRGTPALKVQQGRTSVKLRTYVPKGRSSAGPTYVPGPVGREHVHFEAPKANSRSAVSGQEQRDRRGDARRHAPGQAAFAYPDDHQLDYDGQEKRYAHAISEDTPVGGSRSQEQVVRGAARRGARASGHSQPREGPRRCAGRRGVRAADGWPAALAGWRLRVLTAGRSLEAST